MIERVGDRIAAVVERILALALIGAIVLNFVNVIGRYLGGFALPGVDEVEVYILIWIAFLGAAVVTWRRQHLRMDVLSSNAPQIVRTLILLVEVLVMLTVTLFVGYQSYRYLERIIALGAVSDIARIPMWIPHAVVSLSFALMGIIVLLRAVEDLRRHGRRSGDA